jgi:hypothetical protein
LVGALAAARARRAAGLHRRLQRSGPPAYGSVHALLMKRIRAEGFLLADHAARHDEARAALAALVGRGAADARRNRRTTASNRRPPPSPACSPRPRPGKQIVSL